MFKNNAFIFTFHLKQHTPIILFQIEQEGATLIATKLKPKLDRFIIAKFQSGTMQSQKRYHFVPDMFKFITQTYQILKSGTGKKGKDGIRQCERELKFSAKDRVPLIIKTPPNAKTMNLDLPSFLADNLRKNEWKPL